MNMAQLFVQDMNSTSPTGASNQQSLVELLRKNPFAAVVVSDTGEEGVAVTFGQYLDALVTNSKDPRTPNCIKFGAAESVTDSKDLFSYCFFNDKCATKVCFSLEELGGLLKRDANGNLPKTLRNDFEADMKARLPHLADEIVPYFDDKFIGMVDQAIRVKAYRSEPTTSLKDRNEKQIYSFLLNQLYAFFKETPSAMAQGNIVAGKGWVDRAKGWASSAVPNWVKETLSSPHRLVYWVTGNPYWDNLLGLLSKAIRLILCCYASGVTEASFDSVLKAYFQSASRDPTVSFVLGLTDAVFKCTLKASASAGETITFDALDFIQCIHTKFEAVVAPDVRKQTIYPLQFVMFVIRNLFERVYSPGVARKIVKEPRSGKKVLRPQLVASALHWQRLSDPQKLFQMMWDNGEVDFHFVRQEEFLTNLDAIMFLGIAYSVPAQSVLQTLDEIADLLPPGNVVSSSREAMARVLKTATDSFMSVGQLLEMSMRQDEAWRSVKPLVYEAWVFFSDVGSCYIKQCRRAAGAEEETSQCCFAEFLQKVQEVLNPPPKGSVVASMRDAVAGALGKDWKALLASDERWKKRLLQKPVYTVQTARGPLEIHLYMWRPSMVRQLRRSVRKHYALGRPFYSLSAQQVRSLYPECIVTKQGRLFVNLKCLPSSCEILHVIHAMNTGGMPMPLSKGALMPAELMFNLGCL